MKTETLKLLITDFCKLKQEIDHTLNVVNHDVILLNHYLKRIESEVATGKHDQSLLNQTPIEKQWYNSVCAARYLNLSKATIWKYCQEGKLRYEKPGGKKLQIKKEWLDDYVEAKSGKHSRISIEEQASDYANRLRLRTSRPQSKTPKVSKENEKGQ